MYLRWASLSLFATGLATDVDEAATRRTYGSAGAQADIRLVTLSHLDSTFSFGWAAAQGDGLPLHSRWMFSFKIM